MDVAGFLLILAVLSIGGVVATIGDRMGTKIGKARLSLFKLRPRDTATLVTIFTGVMIAGVSMALVLLVSERARVALFQWSELQANLNSAQAQKDTAERELNSAQAQRLQANRQLQLAQVQRSQAEQKLQGINRQLTLVRGRQELDSRRLAQTRSQLAALEVQKSNLEDQKRLLKERSEALRGRLVALRREQVELGRELELSKEILARTRSENLGLERQNELLAKANQYLAVRGEVLGAEAQSLRTGKFIFRSGERLAWAKVGGGKGMDQTRRIVDEFLGKVEEEALKLGARPAPGTKCKNAVCLSTEEARKLIDQLAAGGDHALQLVAIDNSLEGEPVWVSATVKPYQLLFQAGQVIAARQIDALAVGEDQKLLETLKELFVEANKQARARGILTSGRDGKVGEFSAVELEQLVGDLKKQAGPGSFTLQAVAKEDISTLGPLKLTLVALYKGKIISRAG